MIVSYCLHQGRISYLSTRNHSRIEIGHSVKNIEINSNTSIEKEFEVISQSEEFESVNRANSLDILTTMISDEKCLRFISFVEAVLST